MADTMYYNDERVELIDKARETIDFLQDFNETTVMCEDEHEAVAHTVRCIREVFESELDT